MALGKKTGGRKKGTPNKVSDVVKDNVVKVFDALGGSDGMAIWAADNPTEFYRLYTKLLPKQVDQTIEVGQTIDDILLELAEARRDKPIEPDAENDGGDQLTQH